MKAYWGSGGTDPRVLNPGYTEVSGQLHALATLPPGLRADSTHWITLKLNDQYFSHIKINCNHYLTSVPEIRPCFITACNNCMYPVICTSIKII